MKTIFKFVEDVCPKLSRSWKPFNKFNYKVPVSQNFCLSKDFIAMSSFGYLLFNYDFGLNQKHGHKTS